MCQHPRFPIKGLLKNCIGFKQVLCLKGTKTDHTSASRVRLLISIVSGMRPQGSSNPAGRLKNPLQWLNFPISPSIPPSPYNIMNFLGNQGALGAAVSPAMFVPSNLMNAQLAPAQVHEQPALLVESEMNRTQEYSVSLKIAFCKCKEGFLSGKEEPELQYPNFPVRTRARTWLRFLRSKWSEYSWTEKTKIPCVSTLHNWVTAFS